MVSGAFLVVPPRNAFFDGDVDFSGVSLVMVSVGGTHLAEAGVWLKENLPRDRKMYVIACENAVNPADSLQEAVGLPNVSVSQAAVVR